MKTTESIKELIDNKIRDNQQAINQAEEKSNTLTTQLNQAEMELKNAESGEDYSTLVDKKGKVWSLNQKKKKSDDELLKLKTSPLISFEEFEQTKKELEQSVDKAIQDTMKEAKPLLSKLVKIIEKGLEKEKDYHTIKKNLFENVMKMDTQNEVINAIEIGTYNGKSLKCLEFLLNLEEIKKILDMEG